MRRGRARAPSVEFIGAALGIFAATMMSDAFCTGKMHIALPALLLKKAQSAFFIGAEPALLAPLLKKI